MKRFQTKMTALAAVTVMMLTASSAMAAPPALVLCPLVADPGGGQNGLVIAPVAPYLGKRIDPRAQDHQYATTEGYDNNFQFMSTVFPNGIKIRDTVHPASSLYVHVNGALSFTTTTFTTGPQGYGLTSGGPTNRVAIVPFYSNNIIPWSFEPQDNSNIFTCVDTASKRLVVTWYYVRKDPVSAEQGTPAEWHRNTYQAILTNSSSTCADSNHVLDIEFRYRSLEWYGWGPNTTQQALMGINLGNKANNLVENVDYKRLPYYGAGIFNLVNESTPAGGQPGVHRFRIKDGKFAPPGPSVCGDGVVDSCAEECDLGANNSNTGACTTTCKIAKCGDGLVQTGVEKCDKGAVDPAYATCPVGYIGTPLCKNNPQNPNQNGTCTLAPIPDGCNDVNECTNTPGLCGAGTCNNTPGSYSCTCQAGFSFNGTTCVDINECTTNIAALKHDCKGSSTCLNTVGSYECKCAIGFFYNGTTCTEIDRCAEPLLNTCKGRSTCVNIPGGIDCICPAGYFYNGTTCEDTNECTASSGNPCKDTSTCQNTPGSFICNCPLGFAYINQVCEKIDECADPLFNSCKGTSMCVNTPLGHSCVCEIGFNYNGQTCVDTDECANPSLNTCDENATCTNSVGSYSCACDEGYSGDGETCTKDDPCADPLMNTCDPNAICTTTADAYTCACTDGYSGDGETCTKDDPCADSLMNTCDQNATCTTTVDGHTCACNAGYGGDGETCADIDECADTTLNTCDENATCTNSVGSFGCDCNDGYTGDGKTCAKDDEPTPEVPTPEVPTPEVPTYGPIMGGGLACSSAATHMNTSVPAAILLGLAGLFMVRRRRS